MIRLIILDLVIFHELDLRQIELNITPLFLCPDSIHIALLLRVRYIISVIGQKRWSDNLVDVILVLSCLVGLLLGFKHVEVTLWFGEGFGGFSADHLWLLEVVGFELLVD